MTAYYTPRDLAEMSEEDVAALRAKGQAITDHERYLKEDPEIRVLVNLLSRWLHESAYSYEQCAEALIRTGWHR
jgi:hypothetical protein